MIVATSRTHNLHEIGKLAYWIPWQYKYYIKKSSYKKTNLLEFIAFHLHILNMSIRSNEGKKSSPKNIAVLMLEHLGYTRLLKLFNKKEQYKEYFKDYPDHPLEGGTVTWLK